MKKLLIGLLLLAAMLPAATRTDQFNLSYWLYKPVSNQAILTTSSPTFAGLTLSGLTASTVVYSNASKAITSLANGAGYLYNNGSGGLSWAAVSLSGYLKADGTVPLTADWPMGAFNLSQATWQGVAVAAAYGGTGQSSYAVGDLLYASGATALSKLADVATGQVLVSGGVGVAPAWSASPTITTLNLTGTGALTSTLGNATFTTSLTAASGDEVGLLLQTTVNKVGGNYTAFKINATETAAPGTSDYLLDAQVATVSKFSVLNTGSFGVGTNSPASYLDGVYGFSVYDASTAGFALRTTECGWLVYHAGADFLWYNQTPSPGAKMSLSTDGLLKLPAMNITAGTGTGLTVNSSGNLNRQVYKVTVTYAGFAAAALTGDKTIATLPAKTKIVGFYADTTVAFTGGGVTAASLTVGKSAGGVEYIATHDVLSAAIVRGLADADMGTELVRAACIQGGAVVNWTATTTVVARLTTVTANTSALNAGSTTFYIVTERY